MSVKVELGFTPAGESAPFFTLDDSVKGLLDNTDFVLGGEILADVTQYVRDFSIGRGKSRELDRYTAGAASVRFNNDTRVFDPTYTLSPYYGQIQPKRRIRVSVDNQVQFDGTIWDWDIAYEAGGYSVATANAYDAIQVLTNITLDNFTPTVELSGDRVNTVLDQIGWPENKRIIDSGAQYLDDVTVPTGTNSFDYLQRVSQSEVAELFVSKNGEIKFVDNFEPVGTATPVFTDGGSGIPYSSISALLGSDLLYNTITVSNSTGTVTVQDADSVAVFEEIDYSLDTLINDPNDLQYVANFLLNKYSIPRYRINSIAIPMTNLDSQSRATVLGLELGDIIRVTFTPSGIPPAIQTFAKIIRIEQQIRPNDEVVAFGLEALAGVVMVLNDTEFGKLDSGYFLGGAFDAWTLNDLIYGRLSAGMTLS